ncbi:hypothetical protein ABW21_db0202391 [Orbilia brochopaga]|nr:hypothetical protein ABW21_db0202391 [Drechslerella brochopaga]
MSTYNAAYANHLEGASEPPELTDAQVVEYLRFLFDSDEIPSILAPTVDNLSAIMLRHLSRVPCNNIEMHYSPEHVITISLSHIFDKVVCRERGGGSMELNTLFTALLCALGYIAYMAPARVALGQWDRLSGDVERGFFGSIHCVVLVNIPDAKAGKPQVYLADIGYGSKNILMPIPLVTPAYDAIPYPGVLEESHRLTRITMPQCRRPQFHYLLQYRCTDSEPWQDVYAFQEVEMTFGDCQISSWWLNTRQLMAIGNVVCSRVVRLGDEAVGKWTLINGRLGHLHEASMGIGRYGVVERVTELDSEIRRISAISRKFWIDLSIEEEDAIIGWPTEIQPGQLGGAEFDQQLGRRLVFSWV